MPKWSRSQDLPNYLSNFTYDRFVSRFNSRMYNILDGFESFTMYYVLEDWFFSYIEHTSLFRHGDFIVIKLRFLRMAFKVHALFITPEQ